MLIFPNGHNYKFRDELFLEIHNRNMSEGKGGVREYNTEKEDLKMGAHGWR